jgi:phage-related protein
MNVKGSKRKRGYCMEIHDYKSNSGKDLIMEYIDSLTNAEQIDALHVIECMKNNEFDKIFYKRWEGKVFEVYFRKHNRIFYVTVDSNDIYLLHACRKQKNKTEKTDSKIVQKNLVKY